MPRLILMSPSTGSSQLYNKLGKQTNQGQQARRAAVPAVALGPSSFIEVYQLTTLCTSCRALKLRFCICCVIYSCSSDMKGNTAHLVSLHSLSRSSCIWTGSDEMPSTKLIVLFSKPLFLRCNLCMTCMCSSENLCL